MALIQLRDVTLAFRGPPLFDEVSCQIEAGQRIGLLGRNGSGKTTFMRLLDGEVLPDHGTIEMQPGTRVALLPQEVPRDLTGTIEAVVRQGIRPEDKAMEVLWQAEQRIDRLLEEMQLERWTEVATLSSGMKRRVLLAKTLTAEPDVLLLDEPTNHLDIDSILWLENFLLRWSGTLLFVTHDRAFLRNLATRILEIDRGRLFDWSTDYDTFLLRKEQLLATEEKHQAEFDKKLAEEEAWIRQGIKARRTRNEGRVRALEKMREERRTRRTATGKVRLEIQDAQRSGQLVAKVEEVSFAYEGEPILEKFSTMIMRGDKVGIIGPNGSGKTTLLRILLGQLPPDKGSVRLGSNLQIAYFDQLREQLDEDGTVADNISQGAETLTINGRQKHVIGYLQDFLFAPERARTAVRFLSGGERNRLLLARLFSQPSNVIVLDEPTNDLDTETLEMLEERLVEFPGTILLVSHDREFLNNVVTSTIAFEPTGVREYVGGYDDWLRQRPPLEQTEPEAKSAPKEKDKKPVAKPADTGRRKLAYKEKRELEQLPARIEALEIEVGQLHEQMAQADFYKRPSAEIAAEQETLQQLETELATAYQRWEELEQRAD